MGIERRMSSTRTVTSAWRCRWDLRGVVDVDGDGVGGWVLLGGMVYVL